MIMPRGHGQLLLPANPWFIAATFLAALLWHLLPLGRHPAMPDLAALVLVFWVVHQPRRVGVVLAFATGLLMDVVQASLLGQHALAYTLMAALAELMRRRLLWFGVPGQALQVLPIFALGTLAALVVRVASGSMWPGWWLLAAPVLQALLWLPASVVLLAPQRRPPDPDKTRPL